MQAAAVSTLKGWKDTANPFIRLVTKVTVDDNAPNVPYYQTEEVKEAAFQSEHAVESIHKGLMYRLEYGTPCVQHKCLFVIRNLMLEGPGAFNAKMATHMGKIHNLANQQDVKKGSMEEGVKNLCQAVQQAVNGDNSALLRLASSGTAPQEAAAKGGPLKSEFQQQQEREMKAFKRRQGKTETIVVNEKLLAQFDSNLPPKKFVEAAIKSDKKKYSAEECAAFAGAAQDTSSIIEVCQALDAALRDGFHPLAVRYKALALTEAVINTEIHEVVQFWKAHQLGVKRHTTLERSDNPAKSQLCQQLAQSVVQRIETIQTVAPAPPQAEVPLESAPVAPKPAPPPSMQWDPNMGVGFGGGDMFGGMQVSQRAAPQQQQQQQNGWGQQPAQSSGWGQPQPQQQQPQQPPQQQQQQQQQNSWQQPPASSQWGQQQAQQPPQQPANNGWGQPAPQQQQQPSAQPPQQQQSNWGQPQPQPQQQPQQQQGGWGQPVQQQAPAQQSAAQPAPVPSPAPAVPTPAANPNASLDDQMAAFQANMAAMMQMMNQQAGAVPPPAQPPVAQPPQQQQPPPQPQVQAPPQQQGWGSSATMPPPIPEQRERSSSVRSNASHTNSAGQFGGNGTCSETGSLNNSYQPQQPPMRSASVASDLASHNSHQQQGSVEAYAPPMQVPEPAAPAPQQQQEPAPMPAATPTPPAAAPAGDQTQMILQLQAQIAETAKILQSQQQMLATLMPQQPPQ